MKTQEIPDPTDIDERTASTTITSFRIIEELNRQETAGISDIAAELDLAKGTVHKHLTTLRTIGYVVKYEGSYRLGLGFFKIGAGIRQRNVLYHIAQEPLTKLANATDETVNLVVREQEFGVYLICKNTTGDSRSGPNEGEFVPLYATAAGKAILSRMASDRRNEILDRQKFNSLTNETITDKDALLRELDDLFDQRTAYDRGEYHPDLHCVAAPVNNKGRAVGAVSLSGPAERMQQKSKNADFRSIIQSTASSIEGRLSGI